MAQPDPNEEWAARQILKEKNGYYYIAWDGIDPNTSKPWKPTWEPKSCANEALVMDWRKRKESSRARRGHLQASISASTRGKFVPGNPDPQFIPNCLITTVLTVDLVVSPSSEACENNGGLPSKHKKYPMEMMSTPTATIQGKCPPAILHTSSSEIYLFT
jgi:hypothetical protein